MMLEVSAAEETDERPTTVGELLQGQMEDQFCRQAAEKA